MGVWKLESITPEKAKKYHATMGVNRTMTDPRVVEYSGMMRRGEWKLTHQGIAFDENDKLRDGQHRLAAIIHSGCTVRIWVYRGMEESAVVAVDRQQPRTDYQAATISGRPTTKDDVAILKAMLITEYGHVHMPLDLELLELDFYREAIGWARQQMGSKTKGMTHAILLGVIARAYYTADKDRLAKFCHSLKAGICEAESDTGAIRIRDMMITSDLTCGGSSKRLRLYSKIESGLSAFLENRPLSKLYAAESERFPIPARNGKLEQRKLL